MAVVQGRKVYSDWSGGHWGNLGPFKCDDNQYRAINLQLYSNGTLGPRPGWKELTTTGTAPNITAAAGQEFYGIIWLADTNDGGDLLFVSGTEAAQTRKLDIDTLAWSSTVLGVPSTAILNDPNCFSFAYENPQQLVVGATKVYQANSDAVTTITYPDAFAPTRAIFFGARLYAWGDTTYPNRVYYSNADSYTFVSAQYFNIGPGGTSSVTRSSIIQAFAIKDMLLFYALPSSLTGRQNYAEWWALAGANPISGALRRIGRDVWPSTPNNSVAFKDAVLFPDYLYEQAGIAVHDGSSLSTTSLRRLGPRSASDNANATAGVGSVATYGVPGALFPYRIGSAWADPTGSPVGEHYDNGLQAWELVNQTWTKASYWQGAVSEVVTNEKRFLYGITSFAGDRILAVTANSTDGSGSYRVFSRFVCQNRPSVTGETYTNPLETHTDLVGISGMEAQLWLPALSGGDDASVKLRSVVVDFDYWQNGYFPEDPELVVQVAQYRIERGDFLLSETITADLSVLADSEGRLPSTARVTIPVPDLPWASAAQVRFTSVKNIAFSSVTIHHETDSSEPR